MKFKLLATSLAVSIAISNMAAANETTKADAAENAVNERIVVVGEHMSKPTEVITDPKQPRLPLPAYDGAGYLRTIPGFSIGRKGGAGGDPSLRGLGGSRISIVDDGQYAYGTCGGRMDPPTAYVYPETYDSITVIKGPQAVRFGPVGSAGTVLFEKDRHSFNQAGTEGRATATGGSFGRQDYMIELTGGDETKYIDLELNSSKSDHYKDGNGNPIQSTYDRNNSKIALGWTPSEATVAELSYGRSSGSAEYADRANKGRVIENDSTTFLVEHDFDGELLGNLDFQIYSNRTNHIMDQFDKGKNSGINVRRKTEGGSLSLELTPWDKMKTLVGADFMISTHEGRRIDKAVDNGLDDLLSKPFANNMRYKTHGLFVETTQDVDLGKWLSGVRVDNWNTELFVAQKGTRDDTLVSGFTRLEHQRGSHQLYVGTGYAERIPDYWEFMKMDPEGSGKAFGLEPEKTRQLDAGWIYEAGIKVSSSVYFGKVDDYILIDATGPKTLSRNIDATIWGGELAVTAPLTNHWSSQFTLSYSRGDNDTDNTPLAQVSPLEGRLALDYEKDDWTMGVYWRLVAAQHRVAIGQGNISGKDLAKSNGFGVLSVSAGWKLDEQIQVTFGVENLLDKTYAEHISRSGAGNDIPGGEPMFQVHEPGRNAWVKLDYNF